MPPIKTDEGTKGAPETPETSETPSEETVIETVGTDDGGDDSSEELDAIFGDAVENADLEEGGEEDGEVKASESVTAGTEGVEEAEPSDDKTKAGEEATETLEVKAPAEEPAKEEPVVEQPTVEPPAPLDPAKVLADYQEWRGKAETLLAEQHYNLTDEQAEEFDTDPGKAIPKLAAKLHMEVMHQSVAMIANLLPRILANVTAVQTDQSEKEKAFFKDWPELIEHRDQVERHGAVYMQMNPKATFKEFTRDVGAQVAVSQKVDLSKRQQTTAETPKMKAHTPIAAGGGPGAAAPATKLGLFEQLDVDVEAYEQG